MSSRNLTGHTVGPYYLNQRIGKGGFGSIYQATSSYDQSVVAIKTLHQHMLEDEDVVERFQREAKSLAALQHPNIVQLIDFDWDDEVGHFMVLEWLPGRSLKAHLKEHKRLGFGEIFFLFEQLLAGLGDAHAQGIVHRDLKPANLFLVPQGGDMPRLKILDFGLALLSFEMMRRTQKGAVMGSSNYMAPEQAMGQIELIDVTTDLYACGCLLSKCLTGRTPFRGNAYEVAMKHYHKEPIPTLKQLQPFVDYPEPIEAVYMRAVSREKEGRFTSPWEFYQALQDAFLPYIEEQPTHEPNLLQTFVATDPQALMAELQGHNPRDLGFAPTGDDFPSASGHHDSNSLEFALDSAFESGISGSENSTGDDVMSFSLQPNHGSNSYQQTYHYQEHSDSHSGSHSGHSGHSGHSHNSHNSNSFSAEAFAQTSMFPDEQGEDLLAQYVAANQQREPSQSSGYDQGISFSAVASAKTTLAPDNMGKVRHAESHFSGQPAHFEELTPARTSQPRDDFRQPTKPKPIPLEEDDSESSVSSGISLMRKRPIPTEPSVPKRPPPREQGKIKMRGARLEPKRRLSPALLAGGGAVLIGAIVFLILVMSK